MYFGNCMHFTRAINFRPDEIKWESQINKLVVNLKLKTGYDIKINKRNWYQKNTIENVLLNIVLIIEIVIVFKTIFFLFMTEVYKLNSRVTEEWAHVLEYRGRISDQNVTLLLARGLCGIRAQCSYKLVNDFRRFRCVEEV